MLFECRVANKIGQWRLHFSLSRRRGVLNTPKYKRYVVESEEE